MCRYKDSLSVHIFDKILLHVIFSVHNLHVPGKCQYVYIACQYLNFVTLKQNMVGPGEVDKDLEPETAEECTKYGKVIKCVIFEVCVHVLDVFVPSPVQISSIKYCGSI